MCGRFKMKTKRKTALKKRIKRITPVWVVSVYSNKGKRIYACCSTNNKKNALSTKKRLQKTLRKSKAKIEKIQ